MGVVNTEVRGRGARGEAGHYCIDRAAGTVHFASRSGSRRDFTPTPQSWVPHKCTDLDYPKIMTAAVTRSL